MRPMMFRYRYFGDPIACVRLERAVHGAQRDEKAALDNGRSSGVGPRGYRQLGKQPLAPFARAATLTCRDADII